jgi:hypothetical protein
MAHSPFYIHDSAFPGVGVCKSVLSVQESGSGTFLRAPLHGIVPAGLVDLLRVTLRTASGKKEPDPGPLNTYVCNAGVY